MQIRLPLNAIEREALRELQAGRQRIATNDPIWNELFELELVHLASTGKPQLMLAGSRYRANITP